MTRRLSEKQIAAISILSQPNRAGMTYEQVAEKVGVAKSTLFEWKKQETFNNSLKDQIVKNTLDRLPDVMQSIPDHIIKDGNAAMFRTFLQMHGLLTDKVQVENTGDKKALDIEAIKSRLAELKAQGVVQQEKSEE